MKTDQFGDTSIGGILLDALTCGMYSCCKPSQNSYPSPDTIMTVAFNDKLKQLGVKDPKQEIVTYSYDSIIPKVEMKHSGLTVNDQPKFHFLIHTQDGKSILVGSDFSFTPGLHLQAYAKFVGTRLKGSHEETTLQNEEMENGTAPSIGDSQSKSLT
mmetsp:Transcript_31234/g.76194  ORF Transcript_31234/g.76194 Transcript_31234/m.76194 type:complete len:157 (-) Transcript_31234:40-510(-)